MTTNIQPFMQGFILYAGMIVAFGPQNLFLLRLGLNRQFLFPTVIVTALVDVLLISLGVGGLGTAIATNKWLLLLSTLGGGVFLFVYAGRSFHSAWRGQPVAEGGLSEMTSLTLKGAILTALSFSLLNPAAYVDTLLIVGTTSGRYAIDERILFGLGAAMASCLWFFTLTYGSSRLSPLFNRAMAWRALDMVSGCIMVNLGVSLFTTQSALLW